MATALTVAVASLVPAQLSAAAVPVPSGSAGVAVIAPSKSASAETARAPRPTSSSRRRSNASASYPVPANAIVVAPNGSNSASGTVGSPMRTLGAAINRATNGATIVLRRGTYHEEVMIPAGKRLTIQRYGEETVWLDGSVPVTDWQRSGDVWYRAGWTAEFNSSPTFSWNAPDNTQPNWRWVDPGYPMAAHPDQVWFDGKAQSQVGSLGQVGPGKFYVDYAANRLYVGSNPSGRSVRASTIAKAMTIRASGTVIRGLRVHRYAPSVPHFGAVTVEARDVRIERSQFEDNATIGLSVVAHGASLTRVAARRNGLLGIHSTLADGLRLKKVRVESNNTERFNHAPVAGGMKIGRTRGVRIRGSSFVNNNGTGFWADESSYDIMLNNVSSIGNQSHGVSLEISTKAIVVDSVFLRNREFGIKVNNTSQVEIWNSTFDGNDRSINVVQDPRSSTDAGTRGHNPTRPFPDPTMSWVTKPVTIRNTIISRTHGNCLVCVEDYSHRFTAEQLQVTLQGNIYQRDSTSAPYYFAVWSRGSGDPYVFRTLDAFRSMTGQDRNSRLLEGRQAVFSDGRAVADVRSLTASVAQPLPSRIAVLVGRPTNHKHLGAWFD